MNFLKIYLVLYLLNQALWVYDGTTHYDVSLKQIKGIVVDDVDYFNIIQIDEIDNRAYFYINNLDKLRSDRYTSYTVDLSTHNDFSEKLVGIYGADYIDKINIVYKLYKPMFAYIYEFLVSLLIMMSIFYLIKKLMTTDELFDTSSVVSSGKFTIRNNINIRFKDVIGLQNVKDDLSEYINYFRHREKYLANGCIIPRGLVFTGPPGTGKTLLAKALAGESGVTFISASGSDFVEIYVGVGAQRVRNLFQLARKHAPSIIFIDEIDAVGGSRDNHRKSHSEQATTLNSLLVEMDGFNENDNILVIAATNMLHSLDRALTRSGRFDKKIIFDRPNKEERISMFNLYMNKITLSNDLKEKMNDYSNKLSEMTAGLTGADIKNIVNQAVMSFMKRSLKAEGNNVPVEQPENIHDGTGFKDIEEAIAEVSLGMVKKERTMTETEKKYVSYHEAGHALMAYLLKDTTPPVKVSIIPRGEAALGYSQQEDTDQKLYSKEELLARICVLLGGRVAEEFKYSKTTTGARDDIQKLTKLAYGLVTQYGMSESIGTIDTTIGTDSYGDSMMVSLRTRERIDEEVSELVKRMKRFTENTLAKNSEHLEALAEYLINNEEVTKYNIEELFGDKNIENTIEVPYSS